MTLYKPNETDHPSRERFLVYSVTTNHGKKRFSKYRGGGGGALSEGKIYYQLRKSAAPVEQLRLYKMLVHHRCFSAELLVDVIY